jgi:flagellar biosynthesis protein FliP
MKQVKLWSLFALLIIAVGVAQQASAASLLPSVQLSVGQATTPQEVSQGLQVLVLLTVLTLAPSLLIMATSFTRMIIVLSLVRQAMGTPTLPPNQVLISLALILTFFVMTPTLTTINNDALQPYLNGQLSQAVALERAAKPLHSFMLKQTYQKDVALFVTMAKLEAPATPEEVPFYVLLPAFIISELKTAFQLGFVVFLPFLVIDLVVSSLLVSMGMMFLPPVTISLPFKIILFVLVDGWHLLSQALVSGFAS